MAMLSGASGAPTQKAEPLTQQQVAAIGQIQGVLPLAMPTEGLPPAYQGMLFRSSIMLQGGVGPYRVIVDGDLPPGVTYEPGFNVVTFNGIPTSTGTFNSEVTIIDANGARMTHPYSFNVLPVTAITPSPAVIADPEAFHITDATSVFFPAVIHVPETFHITDGMNDFSSARIAVPEAFHINDTTTVFLAKQFAVPEAFHIHDATSVILSQQELLGEVFHINDATAVKTSVGILPATTPAGHINVAYSQTFVAAGNTGPATLTPSGTLPTGMSFNGSGATVTLTGIPTIAGTFPFTIKAQDSISSGTTSYSLVIAGASQTITVGTLPTPVYGGAPFSVSATSDSALPVTITEISGPATGTGNGPYTATAGGVVNFEATQAGNTSYSPATPVDFSVTIAPATQNITIGTLPTPVYGGAPFSISATSDSGLPVTITEISGPATGTGNGPYTATGTGGVSFQATQAGNASYAAATPINFNVNIGDGTQTITIGTLPSPTFGGAPFSVSATSTSGLPVTITEVSGPATGSGNGPYTATGAGIVNFQATQSGNADYSAATPANFSVTIAPASQTITIGTLPTPTYGGAPFSVSATSTSGLPVTITELSGPATGSGNGPYTATGAGTVNFQATQAGNTNYSAATPVNFSVNVGTSTQTITIGTLPTPTYGGAPFNVSATSTSGLPVTITEISGPATGSGNGPYTATGTGIVNFQATQAGNTNYSAATPVNFSVTIGVSTQTITIGVLPTPTYGGAPFNVSAISTSGLPVTITEISGPATGSGSGPYTATGAGVVSFQATQAGNANFSAATPVNFSVTIGGASQSITIGALPTPTYGGAPFSVNATSTSGLPVTITEVNGPATGSGNGPYTATGAGVVNFQATQAGSTNYAAATPINFSVTIADASQTITIGTLPTPTYAGTPFSVSATSTSGLPVTITEVSGPATGSGNGPYTATGAGVVNFQATQTGNANYNPATSVNFSVTIAPASQTITIGTLPTPAYGSTFSVNASSTSGLAVTITEISGPATGAGNGPYTTTGTGVVNFQAMQTGNANYIAATPVNFSVTVGKQNSVTTVSANPTIVTPVQSVTLTANVNAVVTGLPTGTVTFFDNNVQIGSPVLLAGGQAQLTLPLLSGTQNISAAYSGDANFITSSSTSSATVNVAPLDFTMTPLTPITLSVEPGAAAVVSFNVTPLYAIYPGPVNFAVTLPPGATYAVTPTTVAANGGPQLVMVTIKTVPALVKNSLPFPPGTAPITLALFLPLLALGTLRRRLRWTSVSLFVIGMFFSSALMGCGNSNPGNGFFGQTPQSYAVIITATSGTVQHTINVTLQVQ